MSDVSVMLKYAGVPFGGTRVILDHADASHDIGFDGAITSSAILYYETGSLSLSRGDSIEVSGRVYRVRTEPVLIADGAISRVDLA